MIRYDLHIPLRSSTTSFRWTQVRRQLIKWWQAITNYWDLKHKSLSVKDKLKSKRIKCNVWGSFSTLQNNQLHANNGDNYASHYMLVIFMFIRGLKWRNFLDPHCKEPKPETSTRHIIFFTGCIYKLYWVRY